jgi:hypothetical protein
MIEARVCMRVFSTLMPRSTRTRVAWELIRVEKREFTWEFSQLSCPGQREQKLHESWWELRSESLHESFLNSHALVNENKSCMRVDESWEARVYMRVFSTLMPWSTRTRVAWELMRVEKREFAWEFSKLSCPGQREQELHESWKREFAWEFSQLSCPGQREQELHESWWELRSESLHENWRPNAGESRNSPHILHVKFWRANITCDLFPHVRVSP